MEKVVKISLNYVGSDRKTYFPDSLDQPEKDDLRKNGYKYVCTRDGKIIYNRPVTISADITFPDGRKKTVKVDKDAVINFYGRKVISRSLIEELETDIITGEVEAYYSFENGKLLFRRRTIQEEEANQTIAVSELKLRYISPESKFYSLVKLNKGGKMLSDSLKKAGYIEGARKNGGVFFNKPAMVEATVTLTDGTVIVLQNVKEAILHFSKEHYNRSQINQQLVQRILSEIGLQMIEVTYDKKNGELIFSRTSGLLGLL